MNNTYFILISFIILVYIINIVRKKKFTIKESFWWIIASLGILFLSIFPYTIDRIGKKLNIAYPPSLLFVVSIVFLIFMNFKSSKKISELQAKVVELAQELAIIKEKNSNKDRNRK